VRSKAEPWNERRVKNVDLGAKGDYRQLPPVTSARKQIQRKDARPQGVYVTTAKETKYTKKRN